MYKKCLKNFSTIYNYSVMGLGKLQTKKNIYMNKKNQPAIDL